MHTKVAISEGFHNAPSITLRIRDNAISAGQKRRVYKHMCGISGCGCTPRHGWRIDGLSEAQFYALFDATRI